MRRINDILLGGHFKVVAPLNHSTRSQLAIVEDLHIPNRPKRVAKHYLHSSDRQGSISATFLSQHEASVLQRISDLPNVSQLYACFVQSGESYLVTDYVEGHPLSREMPAGYRWSDAQVVHLLETMLTILSSIHNRRVIHCDLKPDNIIRRPDGSLSLIDFGAAIALDDDSLATVHRLEAIIGTWGYMPPEQLNGKPEPASDLYALGMLAIQALTGIPPRKLAVDPSGEICWQQDASASVSLAEFLTVLACRNRDRRYPTAEAALDALKAISISKQLLPSVHQSPFSLGESSNPGERTLTICFNTQLQAPATVTLLYGLPKAA